MNSIANQLAAYSDILAPMREAARRYFEYPSVLSKDGVMNIGQRKSMRCRP